MPEGKSVGVAIVEMLGKVLTSVVFWAGFGGCLILLKFGEPLFRWFVETVIGGLR